MSQSKASLLAPSLTVFISNGCIMTVELVAGRLVARFLGSSLYTWTAVIGVVLAGITIGNLVGGRLADRRSGPRTLSVLFLLSSIACVLTTILNNSSGHLDFMKFLGMVPRTFVHVAIVFLMPSVLLGMIGPVVAKIALDRGLPAGRTVGEIYAWGAFGSIVGTFLTGYYLIAWIGTVEIIWSVAGLLLIMAGVYYFRMTGIYVWLLIYAVGLLLGFGDWDWTRKAGLATGIRTPPIDKDVIYEDETPYCYVYVQHVSDDPPLRYFNQDQLLHSVINLDNVGDLMYFYSRAYGALIAATSQPEDRFKTLSIGGGGYVFPRYVQQVWPSSVNDVVEIDPGVTRAAEEAFGLAPDSPIRTLQMDARNYIDELFLRQEQGEPVDRYKYIFEDAFNHYSVPFQLTTHEFNQHIRNLLTDDGFYVLNLIENYDQGVFLGSMLKTLDKSFTHVSVIAEGLYRHILWVRATYVIICSNHPFDIKEMLKPLRQKQNIWELTADQMDFLKRHPDASLLTDNYAPVENLLAPVARHRALNDSIYEFYRRGQNLVSNGFYRDGIEQFENVIYFNESTTFTACFQIGLAYQALNQLIPARTNFERALAYNEKRQGIYSEAKVLLELALTSRKLGLSSEAEERFAEAEDVFQKEIRHNPMDIDVRYMLLRLCSAQQDWAAMSNHAEFLLKTFPEREGLIVQLARDFEVIHQAETGRLAFQRAIDSLLKSQSSGDPALLQKVQAMIGSGSLETYQRQQGALANQLSPTNSKPIYR